MFHIAVARFIPSVSSPGSKVVRIRPSQLEPNPTCHAVINQYIKPQEPNRRIDAHRSPSAITLNYAPGCPTSEIILARRCSVEKRQRISVEFKRTQKDGDLGRLAASYNGLIQDCHIGLVATNLLAKSNAKTSRPSTCEIRRTSTPHSQARSQCWRRPQSLRRFLPAPVERMPTARPTQGMPVSWPSC